MPGPKDRLGLGGGLWQRPSGEGVRGKFLDFPVAEAKQKRKSMQISDGLQVRLIVVGNR